MLNSTRLKQYREEAGMSLSELAMALLPAGQASDKKRIKEKKSAITNWERGLLTPRPKREDIESLARVLKTETTNLILWKSCHKYAPMSPRKVRLVTDLIQGLKVDHALDVLQFTEKRAAVFVDKVLRSAIASADEQEADVDRLVISEARVDEGGVRRGTKRWRPKDRGRAVPYIRLASHIHVGIEVE